MYCSRCGNKLNNESNFCPKCGFQIRNNQVKSNTNIDTVLIILIITVITICIIGGIKYFSKSNDTRTVMIYMVGTDLETRSGLATKDLQALNYNQITSNNVRVVLIAGGTKTWKNNYIDSTTTSIYELSDTGFIKVDNRKLSNMGESSNLTYFLNYVYDNYKSSKYDLLFWNHGGAVDGSEYDELNTNIIHGNDNLKPTEMKEALSNSRFNSNNKLDMISFRTCLNATVELANIFKDYTNYMVASEEVTYGSPVGGSALSFLNGVTGSDSAVEYGKKQIEGYKESLKQLCRNTSQSNSEQLCVDLTYSLIDLTKIEKINQNFDKFINDLNNNLSNNYNEIARIRANLNQYAHDEPGYDMIDLYDMVEKYKNYSSYSNEVLNSINEAIIYNQTNNNYSHGLSIYHPYNKTAFLDTYNNITISNNYNNYINNFINAKDTNKKDFSELSSRDGKLKEKTKEKADFELELTEEEKNSYAKANYTIFVDTKDGYFKRLYTGKKVKLEGNKLKADVQGKLLRFSDIEYDDENCWIDLVEKEVTDKYVDVLAHAVLNKGLDYTVGELTIRIDDKHPNGYIISTVIKDDKENLSNVKVFSNVAKKVSDYTYITFASQKYKIIDENGRFIPDYEGNKIYTGLELLTNSYKFIREDFDSEYDYYAVFKIWDTTDNVYYSKLVKMN